ncbi:MAG: tyrosine-type recombinase/integrase [Lachnospiraceae bacterium]
MKKRKKYPKLPNGYGSIKFIGANRRNPYAVHLPAKAEAGKSYPVTPKALCYVDDWMKGFAVLTAVKTGTYYEGMEAELSLEDEDIGDLSKKILADYNRTMHANAQKAPERTFKEVYEEFYTYKYEREHARKFSQASKDSTRAAFNNCLVLHEKEFTNLKHADLQNVIDVCPLSYASTELIVSLFKQMYRYAVAQEITDKDITTGIAITKADEEEHGEPFSYPELEKLWANKDDEVIEMILIMCYSGFRISAYPKLEIDLKEKYFKGGVKTQAGKGRVVPIHSGIIDMVEKRKRKYPDNILEVTAQNFRKKMSKIMKSMGMNHTPHDCRHTFSKLCEDYKVNENDRKRMLGHSFGGDITNAVYGHRDLEALRSEIEKIKTCY